MMDALRGGACPRIHTLEVPICAYHLIIEDGKCVEDLEAEEDDEAMTEANLSAIADALEERQGLGTCAELKCLGGEWLLFGAVEDQVRLLKLLLPTLEKFPEDMELGEGEYANAFRGIEVPYLEELHISGGVVIPVIETMRTMKNLKSLLWREGLFTRDVVDAFVSQLKSCKQMFLPKLEELSFIALSRSEAEDHAAELFFAAMGQETSRFENVRLLKVWACAGFECEGLVKGLCSAFSRGVFPSLEHIEIATKMGAVSLVNLCQALQAHPRSFKVIDLRGCDLTSDGIEAVIGLVSSSRVALAKLHLSKMTDEAIELLAAELEKEESFTKLTDLDVSSNLVTDKGLMYLVKAITAGNLTQLERLSLYSNETGVAETTSLAIAAIRHLPKLSYLHISLRPEWEEADKEVIRDILAQKKGGEVEELFWGGVRMFW